MKTKPQLLLVYNAGRKNLLLMLVLTALNAALALSGSDWSFLFTAFFPYICANWAPYGYLGLSAGACVAVGCALPLALWFACWLLSGRERYGWLLAAAALFALDTVYTVYFFAVYGFDAAFVMTVLFHALILWQLGRACAAARRLASGNYEEAPAAAVPTAYAADEARDAPAASAADFPYDRAHASASGANKAGRIALTILLFFAWMFGGAGACMWLLEERLGLGFGVAVPALLAVCLAAIAWFAVSMVRLSPFLEAASAVYHVDERGALSRDKRDLPPFNRTVFSNPELLEERDDCWVVRYENASGRQKKAVIPKAYPGLERHMARVRRAEPW